METKKCKDCEQEKEISEFYIRKDRRNAHSCYCKTCHLARNNAARDRNINTKRRTKDNWQQWASREDNKAKRREYAKEYYAKRSKNEPFYRLKTRLGSWILRGIKKQNGYKTSSIWKYLPYTAEDLKKHLESQFEDCMNWDNHGNGEGFWNVDHIYPQSLLPYDSLEHPNFVKCWALENLRPLRWKDNLLKSNKTN
jgi:hypothetical protein